MFNLRGKNALVTGASGGIGRAIAETLHASGATVTISGTRMEPLEELALSLGQRVHILACDLSIGIEVETWQTRRFNALYFLEPKTSLATHHLLNSSA